MKKGTGKIDYKNLTIKISDFNMFLRVQMIILEIYAEIIRN